MSGHIWRCDVCGREAPWSEGWMWYTDGKRPRKWADPEIKLVVCSEACRERSKHAGQPVLKS